MMYSMTERKALNWRVVSIFVVFIMLYTNPSFSEISHDSSDFVFAGEKLFYTRNISSDGEISCSTCHDSNNYFIDGNERAIARKKVFSRNTPTLLNVNRYSTYLWDGRETSLRAQIREPLFRHDELGSSEEILSSYIKSNADINQIYLNSDLDSYSDFALLALAAYVRSIPNNTSVFESYLNESGSLTPEELSGWNLFSGKANCIECHTLPNLTDGQYRRNGLIPRRIILQSSGGTKSSRFTFGSDFGRGNIESGIENMYSFRTPSLFNIAQTAPYMHDGSHLTLEEVVDFYDRGGDAEGEFVRKLGLTHVEKRSLVSFLRALSQRK